MKKRHCVFTATQYTTLEMNPSVLVNCSSACFESVFKCFLLRDKRSNLQNCNRLTQLCAALLVMFKSSKIIVNQKENVEL